MSRLLFARTAVFPRCCPSLALLAAMACAGCKVQSDGPGHPFEPDAHLTPEQGQTEFESAMPVAPIAKKDVDQGLTTASDACATLDGSGEAGSTEAEVTLAAPDGELLRIENDRLYALSRRGGLEIFDISAPEKPRRLGRRVVQATPVDLYVRDGMAYGVYTVTPIWSQRAEGTWDVNYRSRVFAFDVHDPANIVEVGSLEIPGETRESWLDGSVIYTVSFEDGACSGCEAQPRTVVTSVAIDNPASIRQVAQLGFDAPSTSVSARDEAKVTMGRDRLYVGEMVYDGAWGEDTGHSKIRVVDISDPNGQLTLGAEVNVTGEIPDRWAIDESEGVLRVFSRSGYLWTGGPAWPDGPPPTIETFQMSTAQVVERIGSLVVQVPSADARRMARFDGARGYLLSSLPTDPVLVFDLSNATQPKQGGSLEAPGWLHDIRPSANRLLTLSTDEGSSSGRMTASLYDVSKAEAPALISRAQLGGAWTWGREAADGSSSNSPSRKAFHTHDAIGLISVPFSGFTTVKSDGTGGSPTYISGAQLLDRSGDTLTTRGIVPVHGQVRRSFVHRDRWIALSDDELTSFDIGNRDAPQRLDSVELAYTANRSVRAGSYLVSLGEDSSSKAPRLVVVPVDGSPSDLPIATVDLGRVIASTAQTCWDLRWPYFANASRLFANGNQVYVVYDGQFAGLRGQMGFAVLDIADPKQPVLTHKMLAIGKDVIAPSGALLDNDFGLGYGRVVHRREGLRDAGDRIARVGTSIAIQEIVPIAVNRGNGEMAVTGGEGEVAVTGGEGDRAFEMRATVHLVDLANPGDIRLVSSTDVGDGPSSSGLFVDANRVLTSHYEQIPNGQDRARFFLDQVDVSTPGSPNANKTNIPGSLLGVDPESRRILAVDYQRTVEMIDDEAYRFRCQNPGPFGTAFELDKVANAGKPVPCVRIDWSLKIVDVDGSTAKLLDSYAPTGARVRELALGADRIYLAEADSERVGSNLKVLAGIRSGHFSSMSTVFIPGYWAPVTSGTRFAVDPTMFNPNLVVYDTVDPAAPAKIVEVDAHENPLWGGLLSLDSDYAVLEMGSFGVTAVPLPQ